MFVDIVCGIVCDYLVDFAAFVYLYGYVLIIFGWFVWLSSLSICTAVEATVRCMICVYNMTAGMLLVLYICYGGWLQVGFQAVSPFINVVCGETTQSAATCQLWLCVDVGCVLLSKL